MLGFKSFVSARCTLAGIELMHMRDLQNPLKRSELVAGTAKKEK